MDEEKRSSTNVFITGATSPLGLAVMQALAADGHKVTGMAESKHGAAQIRAAGGLPVYSDPFSAGELKAMMKMTETHTVVHLANASTLPFRADLDPDRIRNSAVAITSAAESSGAKYLIYLSYAFLYNENESALVAANDNPLLKAALHADATVQDANMPACVLRTGYIYGAHMPDTMTLATMVRAGRPVPTGDGHNYAHWVYFDDVVQAIRAAVNSKPIDATYNIVDDAPSTPGEFLSDFTSAMGLQPAVRVPSFITRALGGKITNTLMELSAKVSNEPAKQELGWKPKYPTHAKGIEHTLFIWRSEMIVKP